VREVKFPDIEVPAMIRLRADLMLITLSLNLIWFLQNQIVWKELIMAASMTILH